MFVKLLGIINKEIGNESKSKENTFIRNFLDKTVKPRLTEIRVNRTGVTSVMIL